MAGGEPRFGMAWMYMHTQVGTGLATKQARSEALHAHILGSRKPEFVQSQRLTSAESKKLGLGIGLWCAASWSAKASRRAFGSERRPVPGARPRSRPGLRADVSRPPHRAKTSG